MNNKKMTATQSFKGMTLNHDLYLWEVIVVVTVVVIVIVGSVDSPCVIREDFNHI